jgi:hypothetical protein
MEEIEVIKFCRETNIVLNRKIMTISDWHKISKLKLVNFYYKAYQLGFYQIFNI